MTGVAVSRCLSKALALVLIGFLLPGPGAPSWAAAQDVVTLEIRLSETERAALEPAPPQFPGLGGPQGAGPQRQAAPEPNDREFVANRMGMRFPWVLGNVSVLPQGDPNSPDNEPLSVDCRVRYDGDWTYLMAAAGPKRPLAIEVRNDASILGTRGLRLHALQLDPSQLRERMAAEIFASLEVPVPRAFSAEVVLIVDDQQPQKLGLYTALETVDDPFLERYDLPANTLLLQLNGLTSLQVLGDDWSAYAPLFRANRPPSGAEQTRVLELVRWIHETDDPTFLSQLPSFFDADALLRYLAANALTSNVTGFSTIGQNDYLALDIATGKFTLIANELETALGGAVFSGSPEQLADLSLVHPYAGDCRLIQRLLEQGYLEPYRDLLREIHQSTLAPESWNALLAELEQQTAAARQRDRDIRPAVGTVGGFVPGPGGPAPMELSTFIAQRLDSVRRQLNERQEGFIPVPPNFGGGGRRRGNEQPMTPEQFTEQVTVPAGFAATLFATAPEVTYPVAISAEPSGAIYVASDEQGSLGTDDGGGKILRCVDDDGDGVMDRVTVFARVEHPRGVVYRDGTVWVCHPPLLSVFHDDDRDGIADREQTLVTGLTTELVETRGGDHTTNGIRLGLDGWLYIGDGDYGVLEARGTDGSTVSLRGGGILRVRPDGTELEIFCTGLRNPFDLAIDPQFNMFTRDNTNDGGGWDTRVSQIFQSAEYGYPRLFANFSDEIMPTLGAFGGGGGTGSLYVEDESWPAPYQQSLFTGDWGRSAVFHHPLTPDGATFGLTQETFATVPRATGMDLDAQGHLYVASWYNGEASVNVGPHVGFITRISPESLVARDLPVWSELSTPELIDQLRSPQAVIRFHAQGELLRRDGDEATTQGLAQAVVDHDFPLSGRIAALFALKQILGTQSHPLLLALTRDAALREFALRALTDRASELDDLDADTFVAFLNDDSPRVRAQAIISLGRLGDSSVASHLIPLAQQSRTERPDPAQPHPDQVIPHLALRALVDLRATDACLEALDGPHWHAALRALRAMPLPSAVDGLIQRLGTERDTDRRLAILTTLIRLYQYERPYDGSWWGIRPDTTGPYYDPITWEASPQIAEVLTNAINSSEPDTAQVLRQGLQRHQVRLDGVALKDPAGIAVADVQEPIVIEAVDPDRPNQIGNLDYEIAVSRVLAVAGDAQAGAALFKSRSCSACHTSSAGQKPVGPHLADIGKRYQARELLESMMKPSAKIAQGYETQSFLLDSGEIFTGFVVRENGRQIVVQDSEGRAHTIDRDTIEDRSRQTVSAMPTGLVDSLEPEQLANLLAYLQSL